MCLCLCISIVFCFCFFILGWVFSLIIFARSVVSVWDDFVSRAYVTMSIDSFVVSSRGQGTTDISWVQIRDAATKHLKVDMAFSPPQKNYTSPNLANLRLRNPHLQWKWSPPWDRKVDLKVPTKADRKYPATLFCHVQVHKNQSQVQVSWTRFNSSRLQNDLFSHYKAVWAKHLHPSE